MLRGVPRETIEQFLADTRIDVLDIDDEALRWALYAHERYGRGSGSPAKLNFGDFSYGVAKANNRPLLFVGEDFVHTDVQVAF